MIVFIIINLAPLRAPLANSFGPGGFQPPGIPAQSLNQGQFKHKKAYKASIPLADSNPKFHAIGAI